MEHERCYIYTPPAEEERAPKRQRTGKFDPQARLPERLVAYREIWSQQEERIQDTLVEAESVTQANIINFVSNSVASPDDQKFAIPTALVVAGPSIASHGPYFERLGRKIKDETNSAYIVFTSTESPNLKTLLKNLIKKVTSHVEEDDDDDDLGRPTLSNRSGPKLLNFDLGHIQQWQKRNKVQTIVVAIQDSEAFDAMLLIEMIDLFYSWLDRIPFVLLFGIATSAENFEDRLSGKSLRYLEGQKFDVTQSDEIVEKLFSATIASIDTPVRIGPNLVRRILERQKDHVQNVQDFSDSLKYAYMSHFYASYPSFLLKKDITFEELPADVFEAVRNLPSFRKRVETTVDQRQTQDARQILESDQHLFLDIIQSIQSGQHSFSALSHAAKVLTSVRESLQMASQGRLSSIWTRAASGELTGSPLLRETMMSLKKIPSDRFIQLLASLKRLESQLFQIDLQLFQQELNKLLTDKDGAEPLRTQHDVRNDSVRTTVVAQKVLLSKHKATLSAQDRAYSEMVGRFHDELNAYFTSAFIDPTSLFLSEILMYDLKSPHTEVFQPRPRFAIERALASPHAYLGCDCCGTATGTESVLSATQPATAILYQLYVESGALINVSDLWSAFSAICGNEEEENDSKTMAIFQCALAELKYFGMVKPSRKKTDHVSKTMWKGI